MLQLLILTPTLAPTPTPTPTLAPTPTPTPILTPTLTPTPAVPQIPFSSVEGVASLVLLFLALLIVGGTIYAVFSQSTIDKKFFSYPYITWYLLHYTIAGLGIIMIVFLGFVRIIDTTAIGALLGGLFGYVLGASSARSQAVTGSSPSPLKITTSSPLPDATRGQAYNAPPLMASGGQTPYTWLASTGLETYGLALQPDGTIKGTPGNLGSPKFTAFVTDSNQNTSHSEFTLSIK